MEAAKPLGFETGEPPMGALPRDAHGFRHMGYGHSLISHPFDQQSPAEKRQSSITVTHEDLRLVKTDISTAPEVFFYRSSRHQRPGRVQLVVAIADVTPACDGGIPEIAVLAISGLTSAKPKTKRA